MSEETIIDGIDVGKCNFLGAKLTKKYMCTCEGIDFCSEEPNCYYKQYKRLEEFLPDVNGRYCKAVDDLKAKEQECVKLRLDLIDAKAYGDYLNNLALSKTLDTVSEQLDKLKLQIAYKKAEEEELKKIIKPYLAREDDLEVYNLDWIIKGFCNQLDQLKTKNEELEKWKKEHLKDVEFIERNPVIDILNSTAENILLEQRNERLSQTLEEIKGIAEENIRIADLEGLNGVYRRGLADQIRQKINEVLPDEKS